MEKKLYKLKKNLLIILSLLLIGSSNAKDEIKISTNFDLEILDSLPLAPNFLVPAKSKIIITQAETVVAIGAAIHP